MGCLKLTYRSETPTLKVVRNTLKESEKPCAGAYRFGFNGMEKDDEITGVTGSHLDFGARIYDSRVGRWLSVDPYFKEYVPISPYTFSLDNPIYFVDADGNIVVDSEGNEVTISVKDNGDGNYTATFKFAKGTDDKVKEDFMKHGGRVIKAMIEVPKGREIVENMAAKKDHISIEISDENKMQLVEKDGRKVLKGKLGNTKVTGEIVNRDNKTGDAVHKYYKIRIIVYKGSIDEASKYNNPEYVNNKLNDEQKIGVTGAHEGYHATKDVETLVKQGKKGLTKDQHKGAYSAGSTAAKQYGKKNQEKK